MTILESIGSVLSNFRKKEHKRAIEYNKKPFEQRDKDSKRVSNIVGAVTGTTGAATALSKVHNNEYLTPIQKGLITGGVGLTKGLIFKAGTRYLTKPKK